MSPLLRAGLGSITFITTASHLKKVLGWAAQVAICPLGTCCIESITAQKTDLGETFLCGAAAFTCDALVHGNLALAADEKSHVVGAAIVFLTASTHKNNRDLETERGAHVAAVWRVRLKRSILGTGEKALLKTTQQNDFSAMTRRELSSDLYW